VGFLLPKVWVRVFGPRRELYEFLELWEVGSMMGSTQIVDMETTRKNSFGRILVVVLNSGLIPEQLDVVIGDHYFELEFEVERMGIDENGEEAEFDWPKGARKDDGEVFFLRRDSRVRRSLVGGRLRSLREVWAAVRGRGELRSPRIQKMVLSHGRSRFRT
jgi:hypothetical protein